MNLNRATEDQRYPRGMRAPRIFLLIAPVLFALYALLTPPFQNFDENQHVYRAWQISSLRLTGERRGQQSGGELPAGLTSATVQEIGSLVPQGQRQIVTRPASQMFGRNTPIRSGSPRRFYDFYGAVAYPPYVYVPQVISVWLGQVAGLSIEWTVRLGRLLNSALCICLIWWALKLIPYGSWIMLIVGLLPPTVSTAASFGQDGLITGASFLVIAAGLRATVERRWSSRTIRVFSVAAIAVTVSKIVYFPLFAFAALPKPKGVSWRKWLSVPLVTGLVALILLLLWMGINAPALVTKIRPGVPPIREQLAWASTHWDFWALIGRTYGLWLPRLWLLLYIFGDSTVPLVISAAPAGTAALLISLLYGDDNVSDLPVARRAWLVLSVAAIGLLIAFTMFLLLSPRGALLIEGIQARYFIPVLPMLGIALMRRGKPAHRSVLMLAIGLTLFANGAVIGTILRTFYSF